MSIGVIICANGIISKKMTQKIARNTKGIGIQQLLDIEQSQLPSDAIAAGLPIYAVVRVKKVAGLSDEQMAQTVGMSRRTLSRRIQSAKLDKTKRLTPTESDRVYRLARIIARAVEVFGDEKEAQNWLKEPKSALSGQTPIEAIKTEPGVQQVDLLLGRIEQGIFA
jgi:putative toxin-antitoxin system antitoxin component (TIGR02293 family)